MKERVEYRRTREILSRPSLARGQTQTSTVFRARHKTVHHLHHPVWNVFFFSLHARAKVLDLGRSNKQIYKVN